MRVGSRNSAAWRSRRAGPAPWRSQLYRRKARLRQAAWRQRRRSTDGDPNGFRQLAGDALVNLGGKVGSLVFRDSIEIEHVLLAPIQNIFEARKQIYFFTI